MIQDEHEALILKKEKRKGVLCCYVPQRLVLCLLAFFGFVNVYGIIFLK